MKKNFLAILVFSFSTFIMAGCSTAEIENQSSKDSIVGPSKYKSDFSLFNFNVCYPKTSLNEINVIISRVEKGLLSKKDLAEPLNNVAMSFDASRMMLSSDTLYLDNPEASEVLPESERSKYLNFLSEQNVWFSRFRVALIDNGTLDIEVLKSKIQKDLEIIKPICKE